MLRNYLKIAVRNLKKDKGYSAINILGLAVGIAVCILIFRYVSYQLSYDEYHSKSDRIYRITMDHPRAHLAVTPSIILPTSKQLFPTIETGVRIFDAGSSHPVVMQYKNQVFEESSVAYADSTLFDVFDFNLVSGNKKTALVKPRSVIISQDIAKKYFSGLNPIGKSMQINSRTGDNSYEVTGVMENIPDNSHFKFDFFISMSTLNDWGQLSDNVWKAANFYTYLVLDKQANAGDLQQKMNNYVSKNFSDNEFAASLELKLEPVTDIHLYSTVQEDIAPQGDIQYVLAASAIALLILIIACINYMNLATARSARRSREVGIRKVLGSERRWLMAQFYGESAFLTIIAMIISIFLIELFLPWFNQLIGQTLTIDYASFQFWSMMIGIVAFITLVAGSYPALMLSSFKPSTVLKDNTTTNGNTTLRKILVVFQFTASIFLIISTLVIYRQINFIQQKELGYKKDNVLVLTTYGDVENRFDTFQSQLKQHSDISSAAMVSETPTRINAGYSPDIEGVNEGPNFLVTGWRVNPEFKETLGIELVAGRSFTKGDYDRANQTNAQGRSQGAIMVNEATAAHFGLEPEELVGRTASLGGITGPIIGVVKNFHFSSLHRSIEPLFIFPRDGFNKLLVRFNTADVQKALGETRAVWTKLFPQYPFEYEFLDSEYNALYKEEAQAGRIFTSFAILAIFVACLGLVGLSSFMVERRTREIGIRKVLGATSTQVMVLFSKDFLLLIGIGFMMAVPIAWYAMSQWLQNFAYRINIHWTIFILAGFLTLIIALMAVGYQAIRAARLDPAKSLKSE